MVTLQFLLPRLGVSNQLFRQSSQSSAGGQLALLPHHLGPWLGCKMHRLKGSHTTQTQFWGSTTPPSWQGAFGWHLQGLLSLGDNIPSSHSTQGRGSILSLCTSKMTTQPWSWCTHLESFGLDKVLQPWKQSLAVEAVCKVATGSLCISHPQSVVRRGFSLVQIHLKVSSCLKWVSCTPQIDGKPNRLHQKSARTDTGIQQKLTNSAKANKRWASWCRVLEENKFYCICAYNTSHCSSGHNSRKVKWNWKMCKKKKKIEM